jgi:hypothetical protein
LNQAIAEFLSGNPKSQIRNLRENIYDGHAGDKNGADEDSGSSSENSETPVSASGYFS